MLFCKKCGNQLEDELKFCVKCGATTEDTAHEKTPESSPTRILAPASAKRRFANYLIDRTAFTLAVIAVFVLNSSFALQPSIRLAELLAFIAYYIICEGLWQKTLGKVITKTKVVDLQGNKPSFSKVVGRSFARFIPLNAFSFLVGDIPIGWHDSLSGTLVVPAKMTAEEVRHINFAELRNQKLNGKLIIIIAALFVGIILIGIVSSVVLVTLQTTHQLGTDSVVKADLLELNAESEYYYHLHNGYSGFCSDEKSLQLLRKASAAGTVDMNETGYICNDEAGYYASFSPSHAGGYWCVDNRKTSIRTTTPPGDRTICPSY